MGDRYNQAAEMVLQYITGHSDKFAGFEPDWKQPFPADQVSAKQPFLKKIAAAVDKALEYQLSEFQVSWAVHLHYKHGLDVYNDRNGLTLKPLQLEAPNN